MSDTLTICACGRAFTQEQSSGKWCFRCKLDNLSFSFVGGGGYSRESFHNHTVGEIQREQMRESRAKGYDLEKISTRKELI